MNLTDAHDTIVKEIAIKGSAERICEPMCTLMPCASSHRLFFASR